MTVGFGLGLYAFFMVFLFVFFFIFTRAILLVFGVSFLFIFLLGQYELGCLYHCSLMTKKAEVTCCV